jgi:hypothetical protein
LLLFYYVMLYYSILITLHSFNILLKRNYEPVIADFGEARYLDTNNGGTSFKELTRQPGVCHYAYNALLLLINRLLEPEVDGP